MSEFRMKRINELVRQELSKLVRKLLPLEDYGLISITDVDVSKDLKTANIYVSTVGGKAKIAEVLQALSDIRKDLQYELSRKVIIKYTPHLIFRKDEGLERGQHILEILDSLDTKKDDEDKNLE
jgi:ribosome-binding factor A